MFNRKLTFALREIRSIDIENINILIALTFLFSKLTKSCRRKISKCSDQSIGLFPVTLHHKNVYPVTVRSSNVLSRLSSFILSASFSKARPSRRNVGTPVDSFSRNSSFFLPYIGQHMLNVCESACIDVVCQTSRTRVDSHSLSTIGTPTFCAVSARPNHTKS